VRIGEPPKKLLGRSSDRLWGPPGGEQLQQVGRQAYLFPLAANVVHAAQTEAPEAAPLLDLSEDRLDDRLAFLINGSSRFGYSLWRMASLAVAWPGGGSVAVSIVSSCLSRPVAICRSMPTTLSSVTLALHQ
jgi:hypothetical protein